MNRDKQSLPIFKEKDAIKLGESSFSFTVEIVISGINGSGK